MSGHDGDGGNHVGSRAARAARAVGGERGGRRAAAPKARARAQPQKYTYSCTVHTYCKLTVATRKVTTEVLYSICL